MAPLTAFHPEPTFPATTFTPDRAVSAARSSMPFFASASLSARFAFATLIISSASPQRINAHLTNLAVGVACLLAAAHVTPQRLRLVTVAPELLEVYAEDGMTLEQLMAFTISGDHARQAQVWEAVKNSWSKEPYQIRRMLTETAVRASDKRAGRLRTDFLSEIGRSPQRNLREQLSNS